MAEPVRASIDCAASLSLDDAIARLAVQDVKCIAEPVALAQADGRILAAPVVAGISVPSVALAAMDGYAIWGETPGLFDVVGTAMPGHPFVGTLDRHQAVRIMTGAMVPPPTDRVVMQERATRRGERVAIGQLADAKPHIRLPGSDFAVGDPLLPVGRIVGPRELIVIAAADVATITVWRRPRVVIIATGDELRAPGATGTVGLIPDSISLAIAALVRQWGGDASAPVCVRDCPTAISDAVPDVSRADVVVLIGGASAGDCDEARSAMSGAFSPVFQGVAIKPGKPVWYGRIGVQHVLGLPGNPAAALVTARLFLAPLLARLTGRSIDTALDWRMRPLGARLDGCSGRETLLMASDDGTNVMPHAVQAASSQGVLAHVNALIRRPLGDAAREPGAAVETLDF